MKKSILIVILSCIAFIGHAEGKNVSSSKKQKAGSSQPAEHRIVYTDDCLATTFGCKDFIVKKRVVQTKRGKKTVHKRIYQDKGKGSPLLAPPGLKKGVDTSREDSIGAALPIEIVTRIWGIKPRLVNGKKRWRRSDFGKVRAAGIEFFHPKKKIWLDPIPIVDLGPGKGPQQRGVRADLCSATNKALGGNGRIRVKLRVRENVFPERA